MLRRVVECKFHANKADADSASFDGLASVFGNIDGGMDVVEEGAFAESLKERWPKLLMHHGWGEHGNTPVGKWDQVKETPKGLEVKGTLFLETDAMRLAYRGMKEGELDGLSIGYLAKRWEWDADEQVRHLKQVELWEISIVTFPMNEAALIGTVKQRIAQKKFTRRDLERLLRDGGLDQSEAKAVVAIGFSGLDIPDDELPQADAIKKTLGRWRDK